MQVHTACCFLQIQCVSLNPSSDWLLPDIQSVTTHFQGIVTKWYAVCPVYQGLRSFINAVVFVREWHGELSCPYFHLILPSLTSSPLGTDLQMYYIQCSCNTCSEKYSIALNQNCCSTTSVSIVIILTILPDCTHGIAPEFPCFSAHYYGYHGSITLFSITMSYSTVGLCYHLYMCVCTSVFPCNVDEYLSWVYIEGVFMVLISFAVCMLSSVTLRSYHCLVSHICFNVKSPSHLVLLL